MFWIDVLSRIAHVATAITLVGGSLFTLAVLMPSAKEIDDQEHQKLGSLVTTKWKRFVHLGVLVFLVSGFYNYARSVAAHKDDNLYHALVGTKVLLAFGVFYLAAALVGKSEKLAFIRANKPRYLKVLLALAAAIISISGFLKVRG